MKHIKVKTINDEVVKPMETRDDADKRPPRGQKLINAPYANIYACSKKRTGKSSVIANMVQKFVGPETQVHIFCSTVFIDDTYIALCKWLDDKGIAYYPSTSIKDEEGYDLLKDIIKEDEDYMNQNVSEEPKPVVRLLDLDEKPKQKKKKKSKFKELRRLFIFDDLSNEIRWSVALKTLLKKNRHMMCKVIIASQWVNDLPSECIAQLDYVLLFKNHSVEKLEELYKKLDLCMDFDLFLYLYRFCTGDKKRFDFMYVSRYEEIRRNFNQLIILDEE